MSLRLVVIDDEILVRKGIISSVEWERYGIEVAGEATDGKSALELIRKTKPHIVLTDIRMPHMDGLEMIRCIRDELPETKIFILSVLDDFKTVREALRLGVVDYIPKLSMTPEELLQVVLHVKGKIAAEAEALPAAASAESDVKRAASKEAEEVPDVSFHYGPGIYERDNEPAGIRSADTTFMPKEALHAYFAALDAALDAESEAAADRMFDRLLPAQISGQLPQMAVRDEVYHWVSAAGLYVKERGGSLHTALSGVSPFEELSRLKTYPDIREWCLRLHAVLKSMVSVLRSAHRREITKAIDYVQLHYMQPLRVKELAEWVHLSENYFSNVFAKETGKTFIQFLQEIRVEQAKRLLKEEELDWTLIGEKVGFDNPKYFTKVFKKFIGITPKQYAKTRG